MQKFFIFLFFFSLTSCHHHFSEPLPEISLLYSFPTSDTIEITLEFYTQGYIAIGFGTTMINSQIYLAYKTPTGGFTVESVHAGSHTVPIADPIQNLEFMFGTRDSKKTAVTFRRKLNTENSQDVIILTGTPVHLIWAYGADDTLQPHIAHGLHQVTFNNSEINSLKKIILS